MGKKNVLVVDLSYPDPDNLKSYVNDLISSGGALHGLGWATAHLEKLKNQRL